MEVQHESKSDIINCTLEKGKFFKNFEMDVLKRSFLDFFRQVLNYFLEAAYCLEKIRKSWKKTNRSERKDVFFCAELIFKRFKTSGF